MCEVHQRGCEFDDNVRQKILKYNVENGDCKDDSFSEDSEASSERRYGLLMQKQLESSKEESHGNRNDLVCYVNHDVSDEGEWRFSRNKRKRCGRIVRSVVKEFKNENFFRKLCGSSEDVNSGGKNVNGFSEEIMEFLKNSYEGRLKVINIHEKRNHLFVTRLKKSVKTLLKVDSRDSNLPKLLNSEVILIKSFFKNRMTANDERLFLVENVLFHNALRKIAKYLKRILIFFFFQEGNKICLSIRKKY